MRLVHGEADMKDENVRAITVPTPMQKEARPRPEPVLGVYLRSLSGCFLCPRPWKTNATLSAVGVSKQLRRP